jgi:hypothetical protein
MSNNDPRIIRLAGEAEEAAQAYDPQNGIEVFLDKTAPAVIVAIHIATDKGTYRAFAHLGMHTLDELLRDLAAARASLVKLQSVKG